MGNQDVDQEMVYTVELQELRPGDFVARAPSFPTMLALGDTAEEAIDRATRLVTYQVREARAQGEHVPADILREPVAGQRRVQIRVAD